MAAFDGKTALVTGGGTGIGRATAMRLAALGCRVVVAGRREAPLRALAESDPDRISWIMLDLADWTTHDAAVAAMIERHGRIDILINNAAKSVCKPFADHDEEEIAGVIHTNLVSTAILIRKALPYIAAARGAIVNVSSAAGKYTGMPPQMLSAYGASKAGLNHLTRLLATELGAQGIRVNAVAPGFTDTEIAADAFADPAIVDYCIGITPLGRTGTPDDVARVICFLASEDAGWVTGQIVDATGGYALAL